MIDARVCTHARVVYDQLTIPLRMVVDNDLLGRTTQVYIL